MAQQIRPDDPRISWYGMVTLEKTKDGVKPWRIFHQDRDLYFPMLMERTQKSSGVRLAFYTDSTTVAGDIAPWQEPRNFDVCCDGKLLRTIELKIGQKRFEADGLPAKRKLVEVWFAPKAHTILKALQLDDRASLAPFKDKRPRWVTYGSSVTQCSDAQSPVYTWPAIVARNCGLNLINLGFSGECVLDAMVARVMRDIPADFLSMCIGPNIYGYNALNERSFRSSILAFVQIVRERHPRTPYVLQSAIYYPLGETKKNAAGMTMRQMRAEIKAAVETLRARGDKNIHYANGLELFGKAQGHLLADGAHPKPEGYKFWGANFTRKVARKYFK